MEVLKRGWYFRLGKTLAEIGSDTYIITKIAQMEEQIAEMRANQAQTLIGSTLKSQSGNIISTPTGLSNQNFPPNHVFGGGVSTSSTSNIIVPGSSLNAFTLPASNTGVLIIVIIYGEATNYNVDSSSGQVGVVDTLDGTILSFPITNEWRLVSINQDGAKNVTGWTMSHNPEMVTFTPIVQMSAGTHTLSLEYMLNGGSSGNVSLTAFWLGYVILGQQI